MAKIFTKLNLADIVATSGGKSFRKLSTEEPIVNYEVSGTWVFKEGEPTRPIFSYTVNIAGATINCEMVNFTVKGVDETFNALGTYTGKTGSVSLAYYTDIPKNNSRWTGYDYKTQSWYNDERRTIDFGTTKQTVSKEFYIWLTENATKQ